MIDTASAAEVLMFGDVAARVIPPPAPDAVVLVTVPDDLNPANRARVEGLMLRLADRMRCDPRQVVVVRQGTDLSMLDASALRVLGLRRLADD